MEPPLSFGKGISAVTTQQVWHRVANAATLPIGFDHAVGACLLQLGVPLYHDPDQPGAVRVEIDRHAAYDEDEALALVRQLGLRGYRQPGYQLETQTDRLIVTGIVRLGQPHGDGSTSSDHLPPVAGTGWRYFEVDDYWVNLHQFWCGCGSDADHECVHIQAAVAWADEKLRQLRASYGYVTRQEADRFYSGAFHKLYSLG